MRKRLFIVRTPLQFFNAFEAMQRFAELNAENELLVVYGSLADLNIIQSMLKTLNGWSRIIYQPFMGWKKKFYAFQLKKHFHNNSHYEHLFTGMIHHIPLHLMNCLNIDNYWLIDDGNETRMIVDHLNRGSYYNKDRSQPLFTIQQNPQVLKQLKLFTLYDDLKTEHTLLVNDYRYFKTQVSQLEVKKNHVLLIGSNLVETYLKSEADYLEILTQFKQQMPDRIVYYAPHRYLNKNTLNAIEALGYKILKYETILELFQYEQGWCFEGYYSIRSTANDTLAQLYAILGSYFRLPETYFVNHQKWQECNEIWNTAKQVIQLAPR